LWHIAFPLAVILYVSWKNSELRVASSTRAAIAMTLVCALLIIATMTWIVSEQTGHLPSLFKDLREQAPATAYITGAEWLLSATALLMLLLRGRTVLDLWLMVAIFATLPDLALSTLVTAPRYTFGWYAARSYALIASSTVLVVLLSETTILYARLGSAIGLLRRERANRLMTIDAATAAMAHEVRQPLAGLVMRGGAAKNYLAHTPPNIGRAVECIDGMVEAGHRAEEVISAIRGLIRKTGDQKSLIDVNAVARQALSLVNHDLQLQGVAVNADYQSGLPDVLGNGLLLQQVVLNLLRNAIDAMAPVQQKARQLRLATAINGASTVLLSIADSGSGVSAEDQPRIFDPFFTTKSTGTGLGLSICQTIIEEYGGKLRLARTGAAGSVFEMSLPVAAVRS
jgi:signal transduction histidine kinase